MNARIPVSPFKLVSEPNQVSRFQFIFAYEGIEYSYGFALNSTQIVEEFLYATIDKKEVKYFERITSEEGETEVEFGNVFLKGGKQLKEAKERENFLNYKAKDTRPNQLFLTTVFEGNIKERVSELIPAHMWFTTVFLIIEAEANYFSIESHLHRNEALKEFVGQFLRKAATGIQRVSTSEAHIDYASDLSGWPEEEKDQFVRILDDAIAEKDVNDSDILIDLPDGSKLTIGKDSIGLPFKVKFYLQHQSENTEVLYDFEIKEESDGTRRLLNLTPSLFELKQGREKVIVIDELDRRLHPHLSRMIVETVMQSKGKSQLIFTTHDTHLLNLDLLRRDEIWFVEKQRGGNSSLYSLAEFKIRPDLQVEKGYLNGRFGAIPFIGDISSLGWTEKVSEVEEAIHA